MRLAPVVMALALLGCGQDKESRQPRDQDVIAAAVANPGRQADRVDDAKRHPAEIMALAEVARGDKVFELIPGTGYWTRLFSSIVGPDGRVHAVWPQQYARYSVGKVEALTAMAKTPAYENVSVAVQPTPAVTASEPVDLVFTSQNYHDYPAEFMGNLEPSVLNQAAMQMLKPGGVYIVIDHAAAPGTPLTATRDLHRIDPALVRSQVEQAGFEYVGSSDVLRGDGDRYDLKVFDPQVRGNTDKFALKFRKPVR